MRKEKNYSNVKFHPEAIIEAFEVFRNYITDKDEENRSGKIRAVTVQDERWDHDSDEEFFSDYRRQVSYAHYYDSFPNHEFTFYFTGSNTAVTIKANNRKQVESVFEVFEQYATECKLPEKPKPPKKKPTLFIGHGNSPQWRDLKDHLQDKHDHEVEAYEIGSRAGHETRDILEDMLGKSSFAILVMTGEDKTADGKLLARQNVIHEIGLFQGKLGFGKAVVLLEEGTEEFSNIHGIHQVRYSKGNIKETFGEVLATLKRESEL